MSISALGSIASPHRNVGEKPLAGRGHEFSVSGGRMHVR